MNNDFNYKRPTSPRPDQSAGPTSEEQEGTTPVSQRVVTSERGGGGFKKFLKFLGVLMLLAAAAGGAYCWQQQRLDNVQAERSNLQSQVKTLQTQLRAEKNSGKTVTVPGAAVTSDIITGTVVTNSETSPTVSVFRLGTASELWVEVGTSPTALNLSTKHLTQGLGEGTPGQYAEEQFGFLDLKPGTKYFYRAAAKVKGQTVYGGVTAFTTLK